MFGVPFERDGLQGSIDQASIVDLVNHSKKLRIVPKGNLVNTDWKKFAQRVGFAFDPKGDGKWAIHGNWGIFYDRVVGAAYNSIDGATPGFSQNVQVFPNKPVPPLPSPDVRFSDTFALPTQPGTPALTLGLNRSTNLFLADPTLRTGTQMSFALNVQRYLSRSPVLNVVYV